MKKVYMLVGVPASGKTWIASKLGDKFEYLSHDMYSLHGGTEAYLYAIKRAVHDTDDRPMLIETPFSMNAFVEPLEASGIEVIPVFIIEEPQILIERYQLREGNKPYPKGHLTRQMTYFKRAHVGGHFSGTSEAVLNHLKGVK